MATSWNIPALINKIASDIPGLNTLLKALLKWDTSGTEDIPTGAKRMTDVTGGKQLQQYDGASWGSTGKLMHDVDMLDGFHASQSQTAGTIPVRNANGAVPGNITGNAATATEASALANDYVVPVANGGTGANTEAGARQTLGTNNAANITKGVLATARGGTGRTDGMVTDVMLTDYNVSATSVGELGPAAAKNAISPDTLVVPGTYFCTGCTVALNWPQAANHFVRVSRNGTNIYQEAFQYNAFVKYYRYSVNTGASWSRWFPDYAGGSNETIYLSKDGADTNTGLTADSPLLTVGAALAQAAEIGATGTITFRFGPGDWGNITISANGLSCSYVHIYPTTGGTSATDPGNMPTFGNLSLINGQFQVGNIEANYIYARHSYVYVRYYNKLARVVADTASYMLLAGATAIDIKVDSSVTTGGIVTVQNGGFLQINEKMTLASGLTTPTFVNGNTGHGCFFIGNSFSFTGTYAGLKFNVNGMADLSFNYDPSKKTTDSLPGTGSTVNGGLSINGIPTKATALATARTIQTNLGSTDADSFDGTANVSPGVTGVLPVANGGTGLTSSPSMLTNLGSTTAANVLQASPRPGVTGILPVANGGTGSNTKNFVDLTSAQTVAGAKTLTSSPVVKGASPNITLQQTDITKGTNPSANQSVSVIMVDSAGTANANRTGLLSNSVSTAGLTSTSLYAYRFASGSTANAALGVYCSADGNTKYAVAPTPAANDNSNKIATTEWVTELSGKTDGKVTQKGTRTTTGSWSLTGLTIGKPLIIGMKSTANSDGMNVYFKVTSGADIGAAAFSGSAYMLGRYSGGYSAPSCVIVPTAETVTINITAISNNVTLYAYQ